MEEQVLHDVAWFQKVRKQVPQHDRSHQLAEQIAEREGERSRIDDTLAAMTEKFGKAPLSAIADQMKAQAERRDVIDQELVELRKQHQQAMTKAMQPDLLSEKDKLLAQAASVDPQKRYEARVRIATALRETIATIKCMPDRTYEVLYPPILLPEPYPEVKTDQGALKAFREEHVPRLREEPYVAKKVNINASDVQIIGQRILFPDETDVAPRSITFRTVYAPDTQRTGRVVRRYMDSTRPRMTFDLTDVDPAVPIPGLD